MDNKTKGDRIHDLLPKLLNSRSDKNWSGLVDAIGQEDDRLARLIEDVRNQFFIKTASRPYLDRLAANSNIVRPRLVGMGDTAFRKYVPILAYQPKQVKSIVDTLLDIFFLKEATTAFISSSLYSPFVLEDGWTLNFLIDNLNQENVSFKIADFANIASATADEVVASYNRQAKFSYAINFYDSVTKHNYVRIFSNTIGSKGSIQIDGGLANIGLAFNGLITTAGNGANTQWTISKIGDLVTFNYTGGGLPGLDQLQVGDIFLCDLSGNTGAFPILSIDIANASLQIRNLLATPGVYTQTSVNQSKYIRPDKFTPYKVDKRALAWETVSGKITVEIPATPPIVERNLKGGFHVNGVDSIMSAINTTTSISVADATRFPISGVFVIEPVTAITARLTGGPSSQVSTSISNGRLISNLTRYTYTGKSGNTLTGIFPNLPTVTTLHEATVTSLVRVSGIITCLAVNDFVANQKVIIRGSSGIQILSSTANTTSGSPILSNATDLTGISPGQLLSGLGIGAGAKVLSVNSTTSITMTQNATATATGVSIIYSENTNGSFPIISSTASQFTFGCLGVSGTASVPGTASVEEIELAATNSKIIVTTSISSDITKIVGPYVWDPNAPFTLSSATASVVGAIQAGKTVKLLTVSNDLLPDGPGFLVFNYGQNNQEGPVKYLYKAASNVLAIDSSYIFQQDHSSNAPVVVISHIGPHKMSITGAEYAPYVTNPSDARVILQNLISSVTSAGIFIDFLIRYPQQLYGTLSVYD